RRRTAPTVRRSWCAATPSAPTARRLRSGCSTPSCGGWARSSSARPTGPGGRRGRRRRGARGAPPRGGGRPPRAPPGPPRVGGGGRERFRGGVERALDSAPGLQRVSGEVESVPPGQVVVATGPLTSEALTRALSRWTGDKLYFYDSIAPIVGADSVDEAVAFRA